MITILGAGGAISNELVKLLAEQGKLFRLVKRGTADKGQAAEIVSADLSDRDQAICAVAGSDIVFLLVGLRYDHKLWAEMWPRIMSNTIEACKREFITMAAEAMGVPPRYRVLSRPMVRVVGWFQPIVGEIYEMLYQNDSPYLFDSSKFARVFGFGGTPYAEGIRATAASYRRPA